MIKSKKIYYTHDNGGRPFKIEVKNKKAFISMYDTKLSKTKDFYKPKIEISFINIFIGSKGSSVLLQIKSDKKDRYKYLFIGHNIFSFYTMEKIQKYYSPIGNNDVPYPFVLSKTKIYLMLESVFFDLNNSWAKKPYDWYYFNISELGKITIFRRKILVKRLWELAEPY